VLKATLYPLGPQSILEPGLWLPVKLIGTRQYTNHITSHHTITKRNSGSYEMSLNFAIHPPLSYHSRCQRTTSPHPHPPPHRNKRSAKINLVERHRPFALPFSHRSHKAICTMHPMQQKGKMPTQFVIIPQRARRVKRRKICLQQAPRIRCR
jgi:hypothetical protein